MVIRTCILLAILGLSSASAASNPCQTTEFSPPPVAMLNADTQHRLLLNGVGVRRKYVWDVYVGALYLPRSSHSVDEIMNMPGAKRILIHYLRELDMETLRSAWRDGFIQNNTDIELARLQDRLDESLSLFRDVKKGETFTLDYLPGRGTQVTLNGQPGGLIPGEDFYRAILKIWLGEEPAQNQLKECLLLGSPSV